MYQHESEIAVLGGIDLPLDLAPDLPDLSQYASISMNVKLLFSGGG